MKKRMLASLVICVALLLLLTISAAASSGDPGSLECTCTEACTPLTNATTECPVCKTSGHWENGVYVYDTGVTVTEKTYTDANTTTTIKVADYAYLTSCKGLKDTVYVDSSSYDPQADPQGGGNGTEADPYQNLQMGVYGVKPGGTIIIVGDTVVSTAPAIHPYPGNVRYNVLELDRPVTILSQSGNVEYAGKITTNSSAGFIDGSWTGNKIPGGGWDSFRTSNVIDGSVVFDGIRFTHTGGDIISQYSVGSDLSNLDLTIQNCAFTNIKSGSAIRISRNIKSVTITNTDFTVTGAPDTDGYKKAYIVWTDSTQVLTISECAFDGNGSYRAAIHVGNGHLSGTTASITENKFTGFERCIQLALINSAKNTTTISNNTFDNIQLSAASDNTTNAYEYGAIFIHETHQKNGNFDSPITLTDNQLTGTSDRWFYTESTFPIEYFNITMDGEALENMDFHRHLAEGAVTYYPKYPVLAPVTDDSGCGGYILKTVADAFAVASDGDTLALLRDVTLSGADTPESTIADVQIVSDLTLVLAPEITLTAPESANSITVAKDKTLTLPGWYEDGKSGNDGESGGAIVIGDKALLAVNGTLYNGGNIVLNGEDDTNLSGKITLRLGGEVYSRLNRDGQILYWIKYEDKPYYTSGVTKGYTPKYVYYGPSITPVDVTIYMGGESYDGVVGEDGSISTDSSGLPTPGFRITLPNTMTGANITALVFEGKDGKQWRAESYDGVSTTIFKLVPTGTNTDPVRVQFRDGDVLVASDKFTVGEHVNETLEMSIYPGEPDDPVTSVTVTYDGHTYDVDFSGVATLTVRGTTSDAETPAVATEAELELVAGESSVTAPDGTIYKINNRDVLAKPDDIALLFDEIIEENAGSTERKDALEARADEMLGETGMYVERHYEFKYLDLVDEANGNAWVAASEDVTVYWPLPEGTNRYTNFTLLHFEGLHRSDPEWDADSAPVEVEISGVTDTHVVFKVGSAGFSPFVLAWETADYPIIPPVEPSEPEYIPDWLNTEDHFGYIIGYEDGTIRPRASITRAETATIFFRLLTDEARAEFWTETNDYTDVSPADWFNNAVSTLSRMGILGGYEDGTFRPNATITRAEFAKIAVSFFEYEDIKAENIFTDVADGSWYESFVAAAAEIGLIEGYEGSVFRPDESITRAEACTIINRTLNRAPDKEHLLPESEMNVWPDNTPDEWFYADMQEATNSHEYKWLGDIEQWLEKLPERDWDALQ